MKQSTLIEDRYRLTRRVGAGGMAEVFAATDEVLGHEVAVKVLRPVGVDTASDALEKRFEAEAKILAQLRHPAVVRPLSWGRTAKGEQYIVTELLEGKSLQREIVASGPIAQERAARLLVELCGALAEAHAAKVLHRDVKPANVFLRKSRSGEEHACLLDFGIAKLLDPQESITEATEQGVLVGTPQYMAPEVLKGQKASAGADLFALGLVAYVMLAGRLPFDGSPRSLMFANATQVPPRISARMPGLKLDPTLEQWVMDLLSKEPKHRPSSASEAKRRLEHWLKFGGPNPLGDRAATTKDAPPTKTNPWLSWLFPKWPKRSWGLAWEGGLVALVAAVWIMASDFGGSKPSPREEAESTSVSKAEPTNKAASQKAVSQKAVSQKAVSRSKTARANNALRTVKRKPAKPRPSPLAAEATKPDFKERAQPEVTWRSHVGFDLDQDGPKAFAKALRSCSRLAPGLHNVTLTVASGGKTEVRVSGSTQDEALEGCVRQRYNL